MKILWPTKLQQSWAHVNPWGTERFWKIAGKHPSALAIHICSGACLHPTKFIESYCLLKNYKAETHWKSITSQSDLSFLEFVQWSRSCQAFILQDFLCMANRDNVQIHKGKWPKCRQLASIKPGECNAYLRLLQVHPKYREVSGIWLMLSEQPWPGIWALMRDLGKQILLVSVVVWLCSYHWLWPSQKLNVRVSPGVLISQLLGALKSSLFDTWSLSRHCFAYHLRIQSEFKHYQEIGLQSTLNFGVTNSKRLSWRDLWLIIILALSIEKFLTDPKCSDDTKQTAIFCLSQTKFWLTAQTSVESKVTQSDDQNLFLRNQKRLR